MHGRRYARWVLALLLLLLAGCEGTYTYTQTCEHRFFPDQFPPLYRSGYTHSAGCPICPLGYTSTWCELQRVGD